MLINVKKVRLLILLLLLFSVGCASDSGLKLIHSLSKPESQEAIIVGRVVTTPFIDYEGKVHKDEKGISEPLDTRSVFSLCSTKNRSEEKLWDEDCDIQTVVKPANEFFAIKVSPTKDFSMFTLVAVIENRNIFSKVLSTDFGDSQGEFVSFVRGFYLNAQDSLEPGHVYYIGTFNFHLGDKSFVETGDEVYDYEQALFVVPTSITIHDELSNAKKWLESSLGYKGPVQELPLRLEFNDMESKFVRHYIR